MSLLERTGDALFEVVPMWALPIQPAEFLVWLQDAVDGTTDGERVKRFMTYPAAANMPVSLRAALNVLA